MGDAPPQQQFGSDYYDGAYDYDYDYDSAADTAAQDPDSSSSSAYDPQYAAEYWRLDEEARSCFTDLCPDALGESVSLGDLAELCRCMGRPLRDDSEQSRLMLELDTTNAMIVLRHNFVTWLLQDLRSERELERERLHVRESRAVPVAEPVWEEVVMEPGAIALQPPGLDALSPPTRYYYNVVTGESKWELPSFVQCLWRHITALETQRALAAGDPIASLLIDDPVRNVEMLQDLRALFLKYDDDSSGALDSAEFEDLCVAIAQPLGGGNDSSAGTAPLRSLMHEVDPFSAHEVVSWDALSWYWVTNAPFQRRARLALEQAKVADAAGSAATAWERVEPLHKKNLPVVFRNAETQVECWNHPEMEQRVAALLLQLVPSSKLDWAKKIALFFQVQLDTVSGGGGGGTSAAAATGSSDSASPQKQQQSRSWDLAQCARVLVQLEHPMTRRHHLEAAVQHIQSRFGGDNSGSGSGALSLDEATVTAWFLASVRKVEMNGWEEVVDAASGQVYYYHEVRGATQWDPPEMESRMSRFLSKFSDGGSSGGGGGGSSDERIARIFRHYDLDESGSMSLDEFSKFYRALLLGTDAGASGTSQSTAQVDERQIRQIFAVLDTGGDGSVSLDEFQIWWRTKLQLEADESEDAKVLKRLAQRRNLCRSFLENADALLVRSATDNSGAGAASGTAAEGSDGDADASGSSEARAAGEPRACFESILLPRLVAVLGKYPLKGLAHRTALKALVKDPATQEIELEDFLRWYDAFETAEREREELEAARAKAQAELLAQERRAAAKAHDRKMKAKRKRKLGDPPLALDATALSADDAQRQRIASLFKAFDANGSGELDAHELQQLTKALGRELQAAQVQQMLQVMDTSGDGQVSLDEFVTFWTAFQRAESSAAAGKRSSGASVAAVSPPGRADPAAALKHAKRGGANHLSVVDASASLAVGLDLAKTRMLKLSLDDLKDAFSDWRDDRADKRSDKLKLQQLAAAEAAALEEARQRRRTQFVPTRTRRYGVSLDVTWIELEVVECVAAMIERIRLATRPMLRPDAAYAIQTLVRGYVTRQRVQQQVTMRFRQHVDARTQLYYYEDRATGAVLLERPVFRAEHVSSVAPFELDDCDSKRERYAFAKRQRALAAKKQFYDRNHFAEAYPALPRSAAITPLASSTHDSYNSVRAIREQHRKLFVPAAFCVFDIVEAVHTRLLGDIWTPLRRQQQPSDAVLVELIATRHRRQLQQRSSDGAAYLPLHYVVRHVDKFPLRVVRAIASGYSDALRAVDAFGMTPLHLALRERRSSLDLYRVLTARPDAAAAASDIGASSSVARATVAQSPSLWAMKTRCGDTPLHVAILHRAPIELLRWLLSSGAVSIDTVCCLNAHGVSPFHIAIRQFCGDERRTTPSVVSTSAAAASLAYAKAVVHTFFKHYDAARLCLFRTKRGDLPLHLAMDAFERAKQRRASACIHSSADKVERDDTDADAAWVWLVQLLVTHSPSTLLVRKAENGLLPIHLALKYGFPSPCVAQLWRATLACIERDRNSSSRSAAATAYTSAATAALESTMIRQTRTTLLHYAIRYQPHALKLVQSIVETMPDAVRMPCAPNDDLPLHVAVTNSVNALPLPPSARPGCGSCSEDDVPTNARHQVVRLLCERFAAGCQSYNRQGKLPLHLAIASAQSLDIVQTLLDAAPFAFFTNKQERNGLRALVLAASVANPDYAVLRMLVDRTPSAHATPLDAASKRAPSGVTPLFAISLRPEYTKQQQDEVASVNTRAGTATMPATGGGSAHLRHEVLATFSDKFEQIEHEDAYFVEMARAKLRRQHRCPTAAWSFRAILRLVDVNPLDEAVIQRALFAINAKLLALVAAAITATPVSANQRDQHSSSSKASSDSSSAEADAAVAAIALDADLAIVRRVHEVLFEFPANARVQVLGQNVLKKLLPTAFAKAAYRSKIDPYCTL